MAMSRADRLRHRATIGVITALPKEFSAMESMLDSPVPYSFSGDGAGRRYVLGEIPAAGTHTHVVALALMPDVGTNTAAVSANNLLHFFPTVRQLIMCGIAGGIPGATSEEDDVRLGDIVVSDRTGVIHYDFVKQTSDEIIERTPPRPPSAELLEAVRLLQAHENKSLRPWESLLGRAKRLNNVARPSDTLGADGNPISYLTNTGRRPGFPQVFLGPIASANRLVKDETFRNSLRDRFKVKAVEMEGSGIADATWVSDRAGYLVVRGISDFCDARKGDLWQGYAAVVAAAYTRALLQSIPRSALNQSESLETRATTLTKNEVAREGESQEGASPPLIRKQAQTPSTLVSAKTWASRHPPLLLSVIAVGIIAFWQLNASLFNASTARIRELVSGAQPLPRSPPSRFSVAVLHLDGDAERSLERLILEGLVEVEGINVLSIDRTIRLEAPEVSVSRQQAEIQARQYLQETDSSILVWGSVVKHDGKSVPKLYLATARGGLMFLKGGRYIPTEDSLELPAVFWADLKAVLRPFIALSALEFAARNHRAQPHEVLELFERMETLLQKSGENWGWTAKEQAGLRILYSTLLASLPDAFGDGQLTHRAVRSIQENLRQIPEEEEPRLHADLQHALGVALYQIAERESSLDAADGSISAFERALKGRTRETSPINWASTKRSLGRALYIRGEKGARRNDLASSAEALRDTLGVFTRKDFPMDWAQAHMNLGAVLNVMAQHSSESAVIAESIGEYRQALEVLTQEVTPRDWAMTQNNLGNSLRLLALRTSQPALLKESVVAFEASLKVFSESESPVLFSRSNANMAASLLALGLESSDTKLFQQGVLAARAAVASLSYERFPSDWATAQWTYASAMEVLGEHSQDVGALNEALAAHEHLLRTVDAHRMPIPARRARAGAATTLARLGEVTRDAESLRSAVLMLKVTANDPELMNAPREQFVLKENLARALHGLSLLTNESATICEAAKAHIEVAKLADSQQRASWHREATQEGIDLIRALHGAEAADKCASELGLHQPQ